MPLHGVCLISLPALLQLCSVALSSGNLPRLTPTPQPLLLILLLGSQRKSKGVCLIGNCFCVYIPKNVSTLHKRIDPPPKIVFLE